MTDDAVISVLSAVTRMACTQMTPQHLAALHASVELASGLPARPDWARKATTHAELFSVLGDLAGDGDLAPLVSPAAGRLHGLVLTVGPAADGIIVSSRRRLLRQLRARDADGAAREMEQHLKGLPGAPAGHWADRRGGAQGACERRPGGGPRRSRPPRPEPDRPRRWRGRR